MRAEAAPRAASRSPIFKMSKNNIPPLKDLRPGGRRANISPSERKRIAALGAARRWGNVKKPTKTANAHADIEPTEAILMAAIRIFAAEGPERPTLKQIAAKAGVGMQT